MSQSSTPRRTSSQLLFTDNRRRLPRVASDRLPAMQVSFVGGPAVRLVDLSQGGALVWCPQLVQPRCNVELAIKGWEFAWRVRACVLRSRIVGLSAEALACHAALSFSDELFLENGQRLRDVLDSVATADPTHAAGPEPASGSADGGSQTIDLVGVPEMDQPVDFAGASTEDHVVDLINVPAIEVPAIEISGLEGSAGAAGGRGLSVDDQLQMLLENLSSHPAVLLAPDQTVRAMNSAAALCLIGMRSSQRALGRPFSSLIGSDCWHALRRMGRAVMDGRPDIARIHGRRDPSVVLELEAVPFQAAPGEPPSILGVLRVVKWLPSAHPSTLNVTPEQLEASAMSPEARRLKARAALAHEALLSPDFELAWALDTP